MLESKLNEAFNGALELFPELNNMNLKLVIEDLTVFIAQVQKCDDSYIITVDKEYLKELPVEELMIVLVHELAHILIDLLPEYVSPAETKDFPLIAFDEITADFLAMRRILVAYRDGKISRKLFKYAVKRFIIESYLSNILSCKDAFYRLSEKLTENKIDEYLKRAFDIDLKSIKSDIIFSLILNLLFVDIWVQKRKNLEMPILIC